MPRDLSPRVHVILRNRAVVGVMGAPGRRASTRPGDGSGTVILVHGVGSSSHIWDLTGPLLVDSSSVRVVALDQRGHGESDQPEWGYDFASIVADLAGFVHGVGIDEPTVLVGHSWGASVVLHFAVAYPDRTAGIVLVDGGTPSPASAGRGRRLSRG